MSDNTTHSKELVEAVSRGICGKRCLRKAIGIDFSDCLKPDGSNGPCSATTAQLLLGGIDAQAIAAIDAYQIHTGQRTTAPDVWNDSSHKPFKAVVDKSIPNDAGEEF